MSWRSSDSSESNACTRLPEKAKRRLMCWVLFGCLDLWLLSRLLWSLIEIMIVCATLYWMCFEAELSASRSCCWLCLWKVQQGAPRRRWGRREGMKTKKMDTLPRNRKKMRAQRRPVITHYYFQIHELTSNMTHSKIALVFSEASHLVLFTPSSLRPHGNGAEKAIISHTSPPHWLLSIRILHL
jgi:hypothetical protein